MWNPNYFNANRRALVARYNSKEDATRALIVKAFIGTRQVNFISSGPLAIFFHQIGTNLLHSLKKKIQKLFFLSHFTK